LIVFDMMNNEIANSTVVIITEAIHTKLRADTSISATPR
jgi:hypothetical protein